MSLKFRSSSLSDSHHHFNHVAQLLTLEPNPEDSEFGECVCDKLYGEVLVIRADGQILSAKNLRFLLRYVQEELSELRTFHGTQCADRTAKAEEIAVEKVTAEAFGAYRGRRA